MKIAIPPPTSETMHLPRVTVLLAVRNGIRFIREQVNSLAAQQGIDLRLIISDDESTDGSQAFLSALEQCWPADRLTVLSGPGRGYAANFVSLVIRTPPNAGYVAFSDQDDVWVDDRLQSAVDELTQLGDTLGLHLSTRWIADEDLNCQTIARLPLALLNFKNALVESVIPGNASVMTVRAFQALREGVSRHSEVSSHDWCMYQLLSGAEATIIQSDTPLVMYRQHQQNAKGFGGSMRWKLSRLWRFISGSYLSSLYDSWLFLLANKDQLTPRNQIILERAFDLTATSPVERLAAMHKGGFFRLNRIDNFALWIAVLVRPVGGSPRKRPSMNRQRPARHECDH